MATNTRVHEWRLTPLKELISISSLPSLLLLSRLAATLRLLPFATQPIRFLSSIQPLKPGGSDWTEKGGLRAGRGRGVPRRLSPSLCFPLTVCDSSWMGDCSHTLSPPMLDHIPSLLHPPPPTSPPPSPPGQHMGLWELLFPNRLVFMLKPSLLSTVQS